MNALRATLILPCLIAVSNAQDPLPEAPAKKTVEAVCGSCHDVDTAIGEKHDKAGWQAVIATMVNRGARASDQEFDAIIEYLAKYFGAVEAPATPVAKTSNGPAERVSPAVVTPAGPPVTGPGEWPVYGHDASG